MHIGWYGELDNYSNFGAKESQIQQKKCAPTGSLLEHLNFDTETPL